MNTHLKTDDILRRAAAIGTYYGFESLASAALAKKGSGSRAPYPENINFETLDTPGKEIAGFLKHVRDAGLAPTTAQPLFLWHTNAARGRASPKQIIIQFHALGAERSIADAVLMRAVHSLMQDLSKDTPMLRINSMGDKETRSRFARELTQYFRKHGAQLPPDCVSCAKRDVFEAAELLTAASIASVPSPTDHLSEASRKHFEGVLEYLESTDTPYQLAPQLLSRGTNWTETCFEVQSNENLHAWGSRYHDFAKAFFTSNTPSVGAIIRITTGAREVIPAGKNIAAPKFFFVHIGDEAKRESIKMADVLRRARVPLMQSIGIESLGEQMRFVETINPPYILIMGRKEALERSVILRNRASYIETTIAIDSLVEHLKTLA